MTDTLKKSTGIFNRSELPFSGLYLIANFRVTAALRDFHDWINLAEKNLWVAKEALNVQSWYLRHPAKWQTNKRKTKVAKPLVLSLSSSRLRACLHEGGGPQVGEVTSVRLPHLTCKRDHIKMRDCMDRRVTSPKRGTSPTWGPSPPCKQALKKVTTEIVRSGTSTCRCHRPKKWEKKKLSQFTNSRANVALLQNKRHKNLPVFAAFKWRGSERT